MEKMGISLFDVKWTVRSETVKGLRQLSLQLTGWPSTVSHLWEQHLGQRQRVWVPCSSGNAQTSSSSSSPPACRGVCFRRTLKLGTLISYGTTWDLPSCLPDREKCSFTLECKQIFPWRGHSCLPWNVSEMDLPDLAANGLALSAWTTQKQKHEIFMESC